MSYMGEKEFGVRSVGMETILDERDSIIVRMIEHTFSPLSVPFPSQHTHFSRRLSAGTRLAVAMLGYKRTWRFVENHSKRVSVACGACNSATSTYNQSS